MPNQEPTSTAKPPAGATTSSATPTATLPDDDQLYDLEFRSSFDDAWYTARVVFDSDTLVVMFQNFDEWSERFAVAELSGADAVDEFIRRVRPLSQQLQDNQCSNVVEGMTVCASFTFESGDIKFYDAVVEAVHHVEHSFAKEEEECLCSFLLFWKHGPKKGNVTSASVADITLLQHYTQLHPALASFVKMVKEKAKVASVASGSVCLQIKNGDQGKDLGESNMGETGIHQFIIIENLETDLSPSSIKEFIRKQTSISAEAYVFPNLSSESFTRGAIVVECKEKLKKIYDFLNNPDHIVTSSRGRPWFVTEKFLRCGTLWTPGSLISKVEHRGGKEYNRAKRLREVFKDWVEHQEGLHESLALEEKMILHPSDEV